MADEPPPPTERELLSTVWVFPEFLQVRPAPPPASLRGVRAPTLLELKLELPTGP
jgi:hypothetical protein